MPQLDLAISFSLYSSLVVAFFVGYFFFLRLIFFPMTQSIKLLARYPLYQLDFLSFFKSEENVFKKTVYGSFYVLLLCMDILKQMIVLYQRSFNASGLKSSVEISSFVLPSVFLFRK